MGEAWNIPAEKKEKCPVCGNELISVFSLEELAILREEKAENGTQTP
jgi:hypothetical protein